MARPGGLGRGLGALIPTGVVSNDQMGLQDIPISSIRPFSQTTGLPQLRPATSTPWLVRFTPVTREQFRLKIAQPTSCKLLRAPPSSHN